MAGHIEDRWYKTVAGPDGQKIKVKKARHGIGKRYRARYISPDGIERSESFRDGEKRKAETWLSGIEADMSRGQYIDPTAGKISFENYATAWLASLTIDPSSLQHTELRLRLHAFPHIGPRSMNACQPVDIRGWARTLQDAGLAASYQRVIFANVSAVFTAAVDDGIIARNPCRARSVRAPRADQRRIAPWPADRVFSVQDALPERYRIAVDLAGGCGLRQGEVFGLAVDDLDFLDGVVRVVRQVKILDSRLVFAPPKGGKERDVPLPDSVAEALSAHITAHPPVDVTLPWRTPSGEPVTAQLLLYSRERKAMNRNYFNSYLWKPALRAADVEPVRQNGIHALRHFYASVLLDAGENVKALAEYLGHSDPGFTLRTYTHLMPRSQARTRRAVDDTFRRHGRSGDGPSTAQEAS